MGGEKQVGEGEPVPIIIKTSPHGIDVNRMSLSLCI